MAKVFQILVPDNTLVSRIISCENQVTELFVIDRADKNFVSEYSSDLNKPALYILVNRDKQQLYVGETDDSIKRLRNHESKDFWTEAIVFHSTGDTLSTTEVRWLEAKTYETLKKLGYYDLSENKQAPQYPPLKRNQIYTLEPIFEEAKNYICAAGFDIFLKNKEYEKPSTKPIPKAAEPSSSYITPADLQGRGVVIKLNGVEYKTKAIMGYAIVKEYLKKYPKTTIAELKEIFYNALLERWCSWNLIEDNLDVARRLKEKEKKNRHCLKEEFILTSGDNVSFVVSNQWDNNNILNLFRIAKNEGWDVEVVKKEV